MNNSKFTLLASILIFAGLLSGCLEHRYHISVLSDQTVNLRYELRGDRIDLEDGNELLPDSVQWSIERKVEESEDQTTYVLKGGISLSSTEELASALDWRKKSGDSIYFRPITSFSTRSILWGKILEFKTIIPSRKFNESYGDIWEFVPEECRAIEDEEALKLLPADDVKMLELKFGLGVIQWNRARYERAFDVVWNISQTKKLLLPDENQTGYYVAKAGWTDDIHTYLNSLDVGKPQTANLNWWADLRSQFLSRFSNLTDASSVVLVAEIADVIERKYLVSKDLDDDNFHFELTSPGFVSANNGSRTDQSVSWEFSGKDISNQEMVMVASTYQLDYLQITITLFIIGIVIVLILRRNRNSNMAAE